MTTASEVLRVLGGSARNAGGGMARCPAHDDRTPSLAVTERGGNVLVHCHAGCSQTSVLDALRAKGVDVRHGSTSRSIEEPWRQVAVYPYLDEIGTLRYEVIRLERHVGGKREKRFFPRLPGERKPGIGDAPRFLYRLPEVLRSEIVFVVEGERDADTLGDYGFVATTNMSGANAPWLDQYTEWLRGREVIVIPDADAVGEEHGRQICRALFQHVRRLLLFELEDAKDITDWFAQGHSEVELVQKIERSKPFGIRNRK